MTYNLTYIKNADYVFDLVDAANIYTGNKFYTLMVIAVFIIILSTAKKGDILSKVGTASFVCFILSGFLAYGSQIPMLMPLFFLGSTAMVVLIKTLYNYDHS